MSMKYRFQIAHSSSPWSEIASAPFRNKGMYMRVPFEISAKGMKNTDEARSKEFRLIHFEKHTKNNIAYGMKKAVQKRAVM